MDTCFFVPKVAKVFFTEMTNSIMQIVLDIQLLLSTIFDMIFQMVATYE